MRLDVQEQPTFGSIEASRSNEIYSFNPLGDSRWDAFVDQHPLSSAFHTSAWLRALQSTYGYEPVAFTTSPPDEDLRNAFLFCRVNSWLTGRRLVSVPFADHCELLYGAGADFVSISQFLSNALRKENLDYIELRPVNSPPNSGVVAQSNAAYWLHRLDLTPPVESLFQNLGRDSIQRKIRRAEREHLRYEEGQSSLLLDAFYRLLLLTRRRHRVPPQSFEWFRNLADRFGKKLKIRVAFRRETPVAAIVTLQHRQTLVYKYGCSDAAYHSLGGMHLLLWASILEAKREGLREFDLGRSDLDHNGLITFKDRWGAERSQLTYWRLTGRSKRARFRPLPESSQGRFLRMILTSLPDRAFCLAGRLMYPLIG